MLTETALRAPRASMTARADRPRPADARAELQLFFKSYDAACLDFDADAVAALYDLPCLISGMYGHGSFTARGELRAHFAKIFGAYRQQGLVCASLASLSITALSDDFARGEAVWSFSDSRGREGGNLASAYTLRRSLQAADARWRIAHAVTLDEAEKLAGPKRPTISLVVR